MQKMHRFMRNTAYLWPSNRRGFARALMGFAAATVGSHGRAFAQGLPVRVAAASDLKFVLAELVARYERASGQHVQLSLGSSGNFAQQIRQGLPVDLYMAADERYVFQLAEAGLTQDRGAVYAVGRIALLVPKSSSLALDARWEALRTALPSLRAFAIANPEHAPYGRAAREALQHLALWEQVLPKLVLGENIAQATQFVTSGAAQAGITALSLAVAPEVAALTRSMVVPADWHRPLRQRMVLLRGARPEATGLYRFLQSAEARALLQRYGFGTELPNG
jgi:molybdate transport system substrate-binding protein